MAEWRSNTFRAAGASPAIAAFVCALLSPAPLMPAADAQYEQPYGLPLHELTPVEENVGDTGPLSISLRQVPRGLGMPAGFSQVYRVPGRPDLLMRFDGGVMAVFPESIYERTQEGGERALVPADTTFYIGLPHGDSLSRFTEQLAEQAQPGPRTEPPEPHLYDFREALPPGSVAGEVTIAPEPSGPSVSYAPRSERILPEKSDISTRIKEEPGPAIVADEEYRAERVRELLQRAAESRHAARD